MNTIVQIIFTLSMGGSAIVICLQILRYLLPNGYKSMPVEWGRHSQENFI